MPEDKPNAQMRESLIEAAREAAKQAYAPYSEFQGGRSAPHDDAVKSYRVAMLKTLLME